MNKTKGKTKKMISKKIATEESIETKYSHDDIKNIARQIENLKKNEDYAAIFEILTDDPCNKFTPNSNGVFLNLAAVSENTLDKLASYLNKVNKKNIKEHQNEMDVIPISVDNKVERTYKLSNYEKSIIKHRNLKKILNDDNDYEELKLSTKNSKKSIRKNEVAN